MVVQSLCDFRLVGRGPLQGKSGGSEFSVGRMGPFGDVVAAPVLDDHPGFQLRNRGHAPNPIHRLGGWMQ